MNTNDYSMLSRVVVHYLLIQAKIFNRFDCTEIDFTWDSAQIEYFDGNLRFVFNAGRWQILVFLPNNFAGIGVTYNHPIAANTRTHTEMATNVLQWASPVRVTMRAYDNSQNKSKKKMESERKQTMRNAKLTFEIHFVSPPSDFRLPSLLRCSFSMRDFTTKAIINQNPRTKLNWVRSVAKLLSRVWLSIRVRFENVFLFLFLFQTKWNCMKWSKPQSVVAHWSVIKCQNRCHAHVGR